MVTLCVCVVSRWGIWGFLCFLLFLGGGGVDFDFDTSKWCYREAGRALFRCFGGFFCQFSPMCPSIFLLIIWVTGTTRNAKL